MKWYSVISTQEVQHFKKNYQMKNHGQIRTAHMHNRDIYVLSKKTVRVVLCTLIIADRLLEGWLRIFCPS